MKPQEQKHFTPLHRVLHWAASLTMTVLFITGFLRINWMGKRTVITAIENETQNAHLEKAQMLSIAKRILEPMWEWHELAAYVMFAIFLVRIFYMIRKGIRFPNFFASKLSTKERFQGLIYIVFYLFTAISIITGFYLMWIDGEWKEAMETVHKLAVYWFPIFVLLHVAGIVIGEMTNKKGVVSKMIGGE